MSTLATDVQRSLLAKYVGIRRIYVERLFGQYTYDLYDKDLPPVFCMLSLLEDVFCEDFSPNSMIPIRAGM